MFYHSEEYPALDQILDKSFQCFLCSVVTNLNFENELNGVLFLEKINSNTQHTTNKINNNNLIDKLFYEDIIRQKSFIT